MSEDGYYGRSEPVPFDLAAEAKDSECATCLACDLIATHLVELSQDPSGENAVELGSAVSLCERCFALVTSEDVEELAARFPSNECTPAEAARISARILDGKVASARLVQ